MNTWEKKLAAWLHDPAEKSLVLMRTREGHDRGTVAALRDSLGLKVDLFDWRADWLASSADRPNWPRRGDARYPAWEQTQFTQDPVIIHPLSGEELRLAPLVAGIAPDEAKTASLAHFERLVQGDDPRRTFLAFWRFGPEIGRWSDDTGALWNLLPADSRNPDYTIWQHADLVSALNTALDGDDEPALLSLSIGPVQEFIAQARSTSDLWAGSHVLARMMWAGLEPLIDEVGPDAVLFPSLRGIPLLDAWLMEEAQLGEAARALLAVIEPELLQRSDDGNPLFSAALPNKLLALVPSRRARAIAEKVTEGIRLFARDAAMEAANRVFRAADGNFDETARAQVEAQVANFPEVHWSAATWPLAKAGADLSEPASRLREALIRIHPELGQSTIFEPKIWKLLSRELELDDFQFWRPNEGLLYPAVYSLAERGLASAKAERRFEPLVQSGYRCTLCAAREWLTGDRAALHFAPGRRRQGGDAQTVWTALNATRPAWSKDGEHLCAVCALKRLWPTMVAEQVAQVTRSGVAQRFVVSTHAMAVATAAEIASKNAFTPEAAEAIETLHDVLNGSGMEKSVLPRRLVRDLRGHRLLDVARKLPALLELIRNPDDEDGRVAGTDLSVRKIHKKVRRAFGGRPEAYYALLMMDGDRMGAWLSGTDAAYRLRYRDTWHPSIRAKVDDLARNHALLADYASALRPPSPARHATISSALGAFSTRIARHVIEDCFKGKLLYSGGDDVLAMVAVDDLLNVMLALRLAYSGLAVPENAPFADRLGRLDDNAQRSGAGRLLLGRGFGLLNGHLMTLMGGTATASMGAVVAHHQAPLSMVLRELRNMEQSAKRGGRDRFALRVLKRGGGAVSVVSPWWPRGDADELLVNQSLLGSLGRLRAELSASKLSRSGLYRTQLWLDGLTDHPSDADNPLWRERARGSVAAQFARSGNTSAELAHELVDHACSHMRPTERDRWHPRKALEDLLAVGEFFARETRTSAANEGEAAA